MYWLNFSYANITSLNTITLLTIYKGKIGSWVEPEVAGIYSSYIHSSFSPISCFLTLRGTLQPLPYLT